MLSILTVHLSATPIPSQVDKHGLQEPGALVSAVEATWNTAGSSVMAARDAQPAWTWENHWLGKDHTAQATTTHLGALGPESTAIEKTSFLFMFIVITGIFCLSTCNLRVA